MKRKPEIDLRSLARSFRALLESRLPKTPFFQRGEATVYEAYCLLAEQVKMRGCKPNGRAITAAIAAEMPELFADYWRQAIEKAEPTTGQQR